MTRISPILLGLVIFISYNIFGKFLQTNVLYIDGFFIQILFTTVIGLLYLKALHHTLTYKTSFLAAFIVYLGQTIIRISNPPEEGWSTPKLIVTSSVVELLTLITVFAVLVVLLEFIPKKK